MAAFIPTAFIVRHGERLDHADKLWQPQDPSLGIWDPPATKQGMLQAEKTGSWMLELMQNQQSLDPDSIDIVIYTSPFQRCIDTSIGIIKGLRQKKNPPTLRIDLGLGEWMCERFFDSVSCSAGHFVTRQQEKLARQQAFTYSMAAKKQILDAMLPPLKIDYAYKSEYVDFNYPERYADMIHRFEDTRLHCMKSTKPNSVLIFVTHAVGVNALLDSFRSKMTIPLESHYCSISCVRLYGKHANGSSSSFDLNSSDQSDEDEQALVGCAAKQKWTIEFAMSTAHLQS
ncbi:histidine phosphatase superfamily [Parasitella parasitica]|nr:histidine phosphatase superfamily [Parasitella parasitica]